MLCPYGIILMHLCNRSFVVNLLATKSFVDHIFDFMIHKRVCGHSMILKI